MRRTAMIVVMAMALGLAAWLAFPKVAAAEGEWCSSISGDSSWDAERRTCFVNGPTATLTSDITILPDEMLFVTSRVTSITFDATMTNYGSLALWAFDADNKGKLFNHGTVAVAGTLTNSGEFWNYKLLRVFENFTNLGTLTNYGDVIGFGNSNISTLGTISNVRRSSFTTTGLLSNGGLFITECGGSLTYDAAQFTGFAVQQSATCDTLAPKAEPAVVTAPNGSTVVLWNWFDNPGGSGVDPLNCQAMSTVRGNRTEDVTVRATCSDLDGNQDTATFTVSGGGTEPPVCSERFAAVTIKLVANPNSDRDISFSGPYGTFLLDAPDVDDGDGVADSITYADVLPGTHNFAVSLPSDWWLAGVRCEPQANCSVDLATGSVAITVQACDDVTASFAAVQKGALNVYSYHDLNRDGRHQEGEPALRRRWNELSVVAEDGSRQVVANDYSDSNGEWYVAGLIPDREYTVCQEPQNGWNNTQPGASAADARGWPCVAFTLKSAEVAEVWFGYAPGRSAAGVGAASSGTTAGDEAAGNADQLFMPQVTGD